MSQTSQSPQIVQPQVAQSQIAQPQQVQQANPLDQLRDIHQPQPIDSMELAPGWWLLIALGITALVLTFKKWRARLRAKQPIKLARLELQQLSALSPEVQALNQLATLLKRVALMYFPSQQIAALSGSRWLDFLAKTSGQAQNQPFLTEYQQKLLSESIYQPQVALTEEEWQALLKGCDHLLSHLVAKNTLSKKGD